VRQSRRDAPVAKTAGASLLPQPLNTLPCLIKSNRRPANSSSIHPQILAKTRLYKQVNDVPAEGIPSAASGDVLSPGEWMIEMRIERAGNGKWIVRHHCRMERTLDSFGSQMVATQGGAVTLEGERADWLDGRWVSMSQRAGSQRTEAFPADQPICLLRHRADKLRVGVDDPQFCRGVMIWLSPE